MEGCHNNQICFLVVVDDENAPVNLGVEDGVVDVGVVAESSSGGELPGLAHIYLIT